MSLPGHSHIYFTTNCVRDYCCDEYKLKMEITFMFTFIFSLKGQYNYSKLGHIQNKCSFTFEMSILELKYLMEDVE